jgi:hypothetical protein
MGTKRFSGSSQIILERRRPETVGSGTSLSIRMVAGFAEVIEGHGFLVAGARYVPNRQFLCISFRSELVRGAA